MSFIPDQVVNISQYEHDKTSAIGFSKNSMLIENSVEDFSERELEHYPDAIQDLNGTAVNSSHTPNSEESIIKLLFVGRLDEQKGIDILLDAMVSLDRSDINLKVVGAGVLRNFSHQANRENIEFCGWQPNKTIDQFYRWADVLVVPSRWEGFGLVVLESYRNGTPVLVSNRGALPGLVDEGITGHVFDLSVESLTEAISSLKKGSLSSMSQDCKKKFAERYSPGDFVRKQAELIREFD
ncbi:hypothetical protein GCM10023333_04950 [Ferrimonas pelagia]|uniref:Glycosyl transferase family 1 domain-containing protein n=2 Tax=Ferrimonas pelagia TaxID=1177826 RepID=A0ABP9ECU9_9GAMM